MNRAAERIEAAGRHLDAAQRALAVGRYAEAVCDLVLAAQAVVVALGAIQARAGDA
jgi:HEPN domain-containing protein